MSSDEANQVLDSLVASNIFDLRRVVAVVTGGSTGIGLMISTTLMANGATVYMIGLDQKQLDGMANVYNQEREKYPGRGKLVGIQGDVSVKDEALRLADEIAKREKYVTVLFNNAGIMGRKTEPPKEASAKAWRDAYWSMDSATFRKTLDTNSFGPYFMSVAFLPLLEAWKTSEGGKKFPPQIIMTSSMNGWTKDSATCGHDFAYLMSKSAIGHFTGSFAHELLPLGIRVNGIAPGLFPTEMSSPGTINALGHSDASQKTFSFEVPAGKGGGSNRDMGTLALMLVANWFINGETVLIDGGTLLKHASSF